MSDARDSDTGRHVGPDEDVSPDEDVEEHEEGFSYTDARSEQAQLEGLVDEKGEFQEAVDAKRSGEEPDDPEFNEPLS